MIEVCRGECGNFGAQIFLSNDHKKSEGDRQTFRSHPAQLPTMTTYVDTTQDSA